MTPLAGIVVIGVGDPHRRDDGVGPAVAERLRPQRLPGVRVEICHGDTAGLMELWDGASLAVVVDALRGQPTTPGRVHRIVVGSSSRRHLQTPRLDFSDVVDQARTQGRMPDRLIVFAVEAGDVGVGSGLTPAVAAAAGRVAAEIVTELAATAR